MIWRWKMTTRLRATRPFRVSRFAQPMPLNWMSSSSRCRRSKRRRIPARLFGPNGGRSRHSRATWRRVKALLDMPERRAAGMCWGSPRDEEAKMRPRRRATSQRTTSRPPMERAKRRTGTSGDRAWECRASSRLQRTASEEDRFLQGMPGRGVPTQAPYHTSVCKRRRTKAQQEEGP